MYTSKLSLEQIIEGIFSSTIRVPASSGSE